MAIAMSMNWWISHGFGNRHSKELMMSGTLQHIAKDPKGLRQSFSTRKSNTWNKYFWNRAPCSLKAIQNSNLSIYHTLYIYVCVCLLCIYLDTYTYMYIKAKAYISCPMICSWTNLHFLYHPSRARCQQVTVIFASNPCPMPHKRNPWEFPTQISRGEGRRGAKMGPFFPIFELFESETICQIANADIAWLIKEQGTWTPFNLESSLITV